MKLLPDSPKSSRQAIRFLWRAGPEHAAELWCDGGFGDSGTGETGARKTKPPDLSVSGAGGCLYFYLVLCLPRLGLNDARRDEEDQLLVGGADRLPFEQVAQVRDAAQQRYLLDVD